MTLYNADGQVNTTQVAGSSYTGLHAADGSYNIVINSSSSYVGLFHPCGALNAFVTTNPYAGYYAPNGSVYVILNSSAGYSLTIPFGTARVLPTFAFQAETIAADAAMTAAGSPWTSRRKKSFDRMVRRAKAAGVWTLLTHLYVIGDTEAQWLINLANPGTNNLTKVGTPTFAANDGVTTAALGSYYDTGKTLGSVSRNNNHMCVYTHTSGVVGASECGAQNAGSNGFTIAGNASGAGVGSRNSGASVNMGTPGRADGLGFHATSRNNSANQNGYHYGVSLGLTTAASVDLSAETVTVTILKSNGSAAATSRKLSMMSMGVYMTPTQMEQWHAIATTYIEHCRYGDLDINEAGYGPAAVNKSVVVYGTTAQGVLAAYAAARLGYSVALVGGWRDHPGNLGGMSACGLGYTDFDNHAALGGLPRDVFQWLNNLDNSGSMATLLFVPQHFRWKMLQMLDGARIGGQSVPIYYSVPTSGAPGGVVSVNKTGTRITSFTTADGHTFTADYFIDTSYEGDLAALAGCTMLTGREAAGTSLELANGYHDTSITYGGQAAQFTKSSVNMNVDPWTVLGDTNSGLLPFVSTKPALAIGSADNRTQAYNFRLTLTNAVPQLVVVSSTPPSGYSATNYEIALRYMANVTTAAGTLDISDFMSPGPLYQSLVDFNTAFTGGFGTDLMGESVNYVAAGTYTAREISWQKHQARYRELLYLLTYESDSRVTAALKASVAAYGYAATHYLDPHPNDRLYEPPQLYIREHRRLVGDFILDANDLNGTDGTTPRSIKTISAASYVGDSHHNITFADNYSGSLWRCWNEGNLNVASGGTDHISPVPLEAALPKNAEISNLAVTFCLSTTHTGFGPVRMEITAMQTAESLAYVVDEAIKAGKIDLQNVNYANVRTALLLAPDTTPPVIPQVN